MTSNSQTTGFHTVDVSCSLGVLKLRAQLLTNIRAYFKQEDVLEVDTPILSHAMNTDPMLESISITDLPPRWLATSPEFPMKRLLAAGSGSIYQVAKVFRAGESGRYHNPEFTMLEWYRLGWDDRKLAEEVVKVIKLALHVNGQKASKVEFVRYAQIFEEHTGLKLTDSLETLLQHSAFQSLSSSLSHIEAIDWLFATVVQPQMHKEHIVVVQDYPEFMSALARLDPDDKQIARRFEVFYSGVELANGYWELVDPQEQRRRFEKEQGIRNENGQNEGVLDQRLLSALDGGLPDCAGVALGLDRLLMLVAGVDHIDHVLAFPSSIA